jgi:hypothetical protein
VADADRLVIIANGLSAHHAVMLRGVLESAGIVAVVWDDVLSGMEGGIGRGDAKLAVRLADVQRAREIVRSTGILADTDPDAIVDIPESEWSRTQRGGERAQGGWSRSRDDGRRVQGEQPRASAEGATRRRLRRGAPRVRTVQGVLSRRRPQPLVRTTRSPAAQAFIVGFVLVTVLVVALRCFQGAW